VAPTDNATQHQLLNPNRWLLDEAATSSNPWREGKLILGEAGSASTRMADVFKSQPHWRRLIDSDGRGRYRLRATQR
jgi:hypothetical protein